MSWVSLKVSLVIAAGLALLGTALAFDNPPTANSDQTYQQLRNLGLGTEAVSVNNLTLKRDAATFHLRSGTVCFVAPVQGKVTGAVFVGDGNMILEPPLPAEQASLRLLTKGDEFSENFSQMVLRFTDNTYSEIKAAGTPASGTCDPGVLRNTQNAMRHNHVLKYNLDARILQDVLGAPPGGLFLAFVHGKRYNDKEIFAIDPHGAPPLLFPVNPEEVEFVTYDENKLGVWTAFHLSPEYSQGTASGAQKNGVIHIEHQQLDTRIEKSGNLMGKATTTFVSRQNGLRVVPFDLFPSLRVQSVTDNGQPVAFIQEDKNDDADFSVILPKALAEGEKLTITTSYEGKGAVSNEGNGNYYPYAREDWYPSQIGGAFGDYTIYDLTFRIPKGMKMAASGSLVREGEEGGEEVSVWKSDAAQPVAGFQFGRMKEQQVKIDPANFIVAAYANEDLPDWASHMEGVSTVGMMKQPLAQAQYGFALYSSYFGPLPFHRLSMTQQTACNYGQSWPDLVWLPICAFFDSTVRHGMGLDWGDRGYWKVVAPHEIAHQWWGQAVGFNSYRDQWMSEGFADFSASLFLQSAYGTKSKEFLSFWDDERKSITEKNALGFRAIDVGPVTMGYRLNNSRTGLNITRDLIYPKGAYILHMIRMMMWNPKTGDQDFKDMMQDFVKTYEGRAATTEDFKAMVEKHMTPDMDADKNHKMDWFFNEYVYGTALPSYKFDYTFEKNTDGSPIFDFKLSQANVTDGFRMLVPIYLELSDGRILYLGHVRLTGNTSINQKVPLRALKETPKKAVVNYYDDVLAAMN